MLTQPTIQTDKAHMQDVGTASGSLQVEGAIEIRAALVDKQTH